jgi:hypothetical protein
MENARKTIYACSISPISSFKKLYWYTTLGMVSSAQHFQTAMSKEAFQKAIGQMNYVSHPALYEIITE